MFNQKFKRELRGKFEELLQMVEEKSEWNKSLKKLRDPVAHRIPLYAVPAVVDEIEANEYESKMSLMMKSFITQDFNRFDAIIEELDRIGSYKPWFQWLDHSEQGICNVNAQIEFDLDNLMELAECIFTYFRKILSTT